ncbi:MAG: adenylate kinase [Pseudomonadota bacterium]
MIIVLMGAPGAGKGTQADMLTDQVGYRKISTGDALRKHVKLGTPVGKQAADIMARGELVPDNVLLEVLREEIGSNPKEVVVLDGYPRNLTQAETLRQVVEGVHPVRGCVHLDVDRSAIVERLSGRRVCSSCGTSFHVSANPPKKDGVCDKCGASLYQRPDDDAKSISVRLDVYDRSTEPVLDYYRQRGLYCKVNGAGVTDEIFRELRDAISTCLN